jgi:hypothetical protein
MRGPESKNFYQVMGQLTITVKGKNQKGFNAYKHLVLA